MEVALSQEVVGIIGLGPVGTIIGAFLAKSGVTVYGMDTSEERVEQINSNGLVVRGFTDLDVLIERCYSKISQLAEVKDLTALFVCTKTWAIDPVMNAINMCRWPENMRVVAFMNGVGPEDAIGELIDKSKVSRGVANFAGNITGRRAARGTHAMVQTLVHLCCHRRGGCRHSDRHPPRDPERTC